jgi:hypothetical protein
MALGSATFSGIGGAVSDLFVAEGHKAKAAGDRLEAENYDLASELAKQNEKFTETSTAIKQAQIDRENTKMIGGQEADVAGAGFSASGSALDLLRESAQQGALHHAVAGEQGLITEAGYTEQAQSYTNMSSAARMAADSEDKAAQGADVTAAFKGVTAIASIFTGMPEVSAVIGQAANSAMGDPTGIGGLY